jgi:hypothetical protein
MVASAAEPRSGRAAAEAGGGRAAAPTGQAASTEIRAWQLEDGQQGEAEKDAPALGAGVALKLPEEVLALLEAAAAAPGAPVSPALAQQQQQQQVGRLLVTQSRWS